MKQIVVKVEPFAADQIQKMLEEHHILINDYAREYFSHPGFSFWSSGEMTVMIASLQEIGLENGATLNDIFEYIPKVGLRPCSSATGLFLRLTWADQPKSKTSVLTGTHNAPDQAVTVLSDILEENDAFPKGLYLRNVDGNLWLRGYVCDSSYRFPGDALFAFGTV